MANNNTIKTCETASWLQDQRRITKTWNAKYRQGKADVHTASTV